MTKHTYYASDYAKLDSDIILGGGTDDTAAIQTLLDKAATEGNVYIIMDGAALITGLIIHSNTTIECLDASCGFFLADNSNCALFRNANASYISDKRDKNISFIGGSYNHNAKGQEHHIPLPENEKDIYIYNLMEQTKWVMAFEFYGVENVIMRDMTIYNQRTFTLLMSNFKFVNIENINIILNDYMYANNQDGLHFWGPGQFLNLKNITGTAGDDFIALAPDEHDLVSNITDVMIDGVHLNDSDQGIRLLSRGTGCLERVIIKNVTGTYRGYGFIINPWFEGIGGSFKNIIFDTVNIRCISDNYKYMKPFVFKLGGNIENITLKNIHHNGDIEHNLLQIGGAYMGDGETTETMPSNINNVTLDGIYIDNDKFDTNYIEIRQAVNNLIIKNTQILRENIGGTFIKMVYPQSRINNLYINDFISQNLETMCDTTVSDNILNVSKKDIQCK